MSVILRKETEVLFVKKIKNHKSSKILKTVIGIVISVFMLSMVALPVFAEGDGGTGSVAQAIENTWTTAKSQVTSVVDNVVFPVVDMILAVLFFVKVATTYLEYRKHGQFDFTAPAILFACLIFSLTAPLYIWTII